MERLKPSIVAALDRGKIVGIRAGTGPHRFIGIWPVVVDGRLFVRSWGRRPDGWNAALRSARTGSIKVGSRTIRVRGVRTRSPRLLTAVDAEYRRKYDTPGSRHYVFRNNADEHTSSVHIQVTSNPTLSCPTVAQHDQ